MGKMQFDEISDGAKKVLLAAYGFSVDDEGHIIDYLLQEKLFSRVTGEPLTLKTAALLPGSLKVLDADPVSISRYLREEIE
ncbi:MAG: hypothetical protein AABX47_00315 [Nanoarchaeota archaeon]